MATDFFAQSVRIKLALSQAGWLSIFLQEDQQCCTSVRDLNQGRTTDRIEKKRKKAQHPARFEPTPQEF